MLNLDHVTNPFWHDHLKCDWCSNRWSKGLCKQINFRWTNSYREWNQKMKDLLVNSTKSAELKKQLQTNKETLTVNWKLPTQSHTKRPASWLLKTATYLNNKLLWHWCLIGNNRSRPLSQIPTQFIMLLHWRPLCLIYAYWGWDLKEREDTEERSTVTFG